MSTPQFTTAPVIEDKTIQPIPHEERHGTFRDLFTIWFGSNIMVLTIVTGALATTVYGLDFVSATIALIIGNLVGAIFVALHSAQGPQLGVPQMVQTRGQFGSYGSLLVVIVTILMYVGFFAANLVLGGQALAVVIPHLPIDWGVVIIAVVSVVAVIYGYKLIHTYTRILSIVSGIALTIAFIWIIAFHGLSADFSSTGSFSAAGFMGTVTVAALWQIAYAPYVSDYSRYLPQGTGSTHAFWATYGGLLLGATLPHILGALVGTEITAIGGNPDELVAGLGQLLQPLSVIIVGIFSLGVAATNAMNMYCGVLSTLTVGQTFVPTWHPKARTRAWTSIIFCAISLVLAIGGADNFLTYYSNFLSALMYVLVPWTAINLVDYYLIHGGEYHVADFFRADGGRYGRFNWVAVGCYILGAIIQIPFMVTPMYTGPISYYLGDVDISWIIGLVVICPVYYFLQKSVDKRSSISRVVA